MITLDEARLPEITSLLAAGYGLTRREQDVVRLVLLGTDTAAIGAGLFLSPWTVQGPPQVELRQGRGDRAAACLARRRPHPGSAALRAR